MNFEFATATRIVFGGGKLKEIGALAHSLGRRALLVIGKSAGAIQRAEPLLSNLTGSGVEYATFSSSGEPTVATVRNGTERARQEQCDLVIGLGGGSVIDAGKAIAVMLTNAGDPLDYLEVVGKGQTITHAAAPFIAVPTTAGTGAEVTRNAVLGAPEHKVKVSLRSPLMLPRVALVDPELTHGLPPAVTASTGLDALTQLIEPYLSSKSNPLTDAICREGLTRVARSLRRAYANDDPGAREDMAMASLFGGLALANAGLGAAHGLAGPLGGMYDAPHGALCAALLPQVLAVNERKVRKPGNDVPPVTVGYASRVSVGETPTRDAYSTKMDTQDAYPTDIVRRFVEVQEILGDVAALVQALQIPGLRAYGVKPADFPAIIEKAKAASSMKTNPVVLTDAELREILERAW